MDEAINWWWKTNLLTVCVQVGLWRIRSNTTSQLETVMRYYNYHKYQHTNARTRTRTHTHIYRGILQSCSHIYVLKYIQNTLKNFIALLILYSCIGIAQKQHILTQKLCLLMLNFPCQPVIVEEN